MPVYKVGENAVVTVSVKENGAPLTTGTISYTITNDGVGKLGAGTIDLAKNNPAKISVSMDQPGVARVTLNPGSIQVTNKKNPNKPSPTMCGMAFEPEKIPYHGTMPEDFMQFWLDGRKAIADRPVKLTPMKVNDNSIAAWTVEVDSINGPVYGFLAMPKKPGKYPAVVSVPGAGPGAIGPDMTMAKRGYIALVMNVHEYAVPHDAAKNKEAYSAQARKFYYPVKNVQDRDQYFFRRVILGIDRAINHVASMKEFDRKNFIMFGSSQGGAMTLSLTGLNKNITACAANVPAMCDHAGLKGVRPVGWPKIAGRFPEDAAKQAAADKTMAYYDAANFATFITVPTYVSCGLVDTTCAATTVYAAYNRLGTKVKDMYIMPGLGHVHTSDYIKNRDAWFAKHAQ